jgi:hypothetical protein
MLFFCSDLSQFTPKIQKFEAFVACKCNLDITVGWE